jgi:hypothetical protein
MLGIMAPPMFPHIIDRGVKAQIGTLDVCHSVIPSLSSHGDMPWMKEWACPHLPLAASQSVDMLYRLFKHPLIAFQDEHPPEV